MVFVNSVKMKQFKAVFSNRVFGFPLKENGDTIKTDGRASGKNKLTRIQRRNKHISPLSLLLHHGLGRGMLDENV